MRVYLFIFLFFILTGCNTEQTETTTSGNLHVYIPESIAPAMIDQVNAFLSLYSQNGARISYSIVSSDIAAKHFVNDTARIAFLTAPLSQTEKDLVKRISPELNEIIIAYDGILVIVNPKNKTEKMSTTEIENILTGKITKWDQLTDKKIKGKIKIYYQDSSDIAKYLENRLVGIKVNFIHTNSQIETSQLVAKDPLSISFITSSWMDSVKSAVKVLNLGRTIEDADTAFGPPAEAKDNYFSPHPAYILKNYYPLKRTVRMYTRGQVNLAAGFATFVATYEGQKLLLNRGVLPGTQNIKLKFSQP